MSLSAVLTGLQFYCMTYMGQNVLRTLREQVFAHIHRLSLGYYSKHEAGDVMSRITNDADTIQQAIGFPLVGVVQGALLIVWIAYTMLTQSLVLALVALSVTPLMFLTTSWFSGRARNAFRQVRRSVGSVNASLQENLSAVREAQAFNREDQNIETFSESNAASRDASIQAVAYTSALQPTLEGLGYVAVALVAGIGGLILLSGQTIAGTTVSLGLIVAFIAYTQRFNQPISQISAMWTNVQSAIAGGERIFGFLDLVPDLQDAPRCGGDAADRGSGGVRPRLGRVRAGPAGAARRQSRRRSWPDDRHRRANRRRQDDHGQPHSALLRRLRRRGHHRRHRRALGHRAQPASADRHRPAGVLPVQRHGDEQHPLRSADGHGRGSHRRGAHGARRRVHRAPAATATHTVLGERGGGLSLGQRQLLAIARAALATPRILILDEATSSVDTRTERLIQHALEELLHGRTSFVIAHRLSTIRHADQVLAVKDGQIIERGTHDELLAARGFYYDLYMSQFRRDIDFTEAPAA